MSLEYEFIEPKKKCKHGKSKCDKCGVRDQDAVHKTKDGVGEISKLIKEASKLIKRRKK